jgi:hypothetical protein
MGTSGQLQLSQLSVAFLLTCLGNENDIDYDCDVVFLSTRKSGRETWTVSDRSAVDWNTNRARAHDDLLCQGVLNGLGLFRAHDRLDNAMRVHYDWYDRAIHRDRRL